MNFAFWNLYKTLFLRIVFLIILAISHICSLNCTYLDNLKLILVDSCNIRYNFKFLDRQQRIIIYSYCRVYNTWASQSDYFSLAPANDFAVLHGLRIKKRINCCKLYLICFLVLLNVITASSFFTARFGGDRFQLANSGDWLNSTLRTFGLLGIYGLIVLVNCGNKRLYFHEANLFGFRCHHARRVGRGLDHSWIEHEPTSLNHWVQSVVDVLLWFDTRALGNLHLLITFEEIWMRLIDFWLFYYYLAAV